MAEPGNYRVQYVATIRNRGGQAYHHVLKSPLYKHTATSGSPTECDITGWPERVQLGVELNTVLIELKDSAGNLAKTATPPTVELSSEVLTLTHEAAQWKAPAAGASQLVLPSLMLRPTEAFKRAGAHIVKPVKCKVELRVDLDRSSDLVRRFDIDVHRGKSAQHIL